MATEQSIIKLARRVRRYKVEYPSFRVADRDEDEKKSDWSRWLLPLLLGLGVGGAGYGLYRYLASGKGKPQVKQKPAEGQSGQQQGQAPRQGQPKRPSGPQPAPQPGPAERSTADIPKPSTPARVSRPRPSGRNPFAGAGRVVVDALDRVLLRMEEKNQRVLDAIIRTIRDHMNRTRGPNPNDPNVV